MDNSKNKNTSYKLNRKNGYSLILTCDKSQYLFHAEILTQLNTNPIQVDPQENIHDLLSIPNLQTQTDLILDLTLFDSNHNNFETLISLLTTLNSKADETPKIIIIAPFSLITNLPQIQNQIQSIPNLNWRLLFTDKVYSDPMEESSKKTSSINTKQKIFFISPIHVKDYTKFLTKALLNPNTQNHIFYITGKITKTNVTLSKNKSSQEDINKLYFQTDLQQKIIQTQKYLNYQPTINFTTPTKLLSSIYPPNKKNKTKKQTTYDNLFLTKTKNLFATTQHKYNFLQKLSFKIFKFFSFFLTLIIIATIIFIAITSHLIYSSYQNIRQGKLSTAISKSTQANHNLNFARNTLRHMSSPFFTKPIFLADSTLETTQITTQLLTQVALLIQKLQVLSNYQSLSQTQINELKTNLTNINQQLSYLQPKLPQQLPTFLSSFPDNQKYLSIHESLIQARQTIPVINNLLDQINWIAGYDAPREIIVLLQNNNELRATGGFIGSFAHLTLSRGVINNWKIYDVYDADGQLAGHVRPPEPIKNILNEPSWYLRDSNWDPDFATSSSSASWFLNKELNLVPDVIISLNLSYIEKIIQPLTPLTLQGVEEPLTAKNLHNIFQSQIEDNFYPSSNLKKTLITDLATKLINNYQNPDINLINSFTAQTLSSLNSREIQIFSTNNELQNKLDQYNWSGHLLAPHPNQSSATIAFVDSNLGVNKANQFITRNLSLEIQDGPDSQTINLTAQYINSSQSQTKQEGDYKNYLRVYLPPDATLQTISVSDQNQNTRAVDPDIISHDKFLELGVYFPVTINSQSQIQIIFTTQKLTPSNSSLTLRKQSGTQDDNFSLKINSPRSTTLSSPFPVQSVTSLTLPPQVTYNTVLSTDKLIIFN